MGHNTHAEALSTDEKEPAAHAVHFKAPALAKVPCQQNMHVVDPETFEKEPAGHGVQEEGPETKVPGEHAEHVEAPCAGVTKPIGQEVQVVEPDRLVKEPT